MEEKQFYHYMQYFDRDFLLKSKQHAFYLDSLSRRYLEKNLPRKWYFLPLPLQNGGVLNFSLSFFQNKILLTDIHKSSRDLETCIGCFCSHFCFLKWELEGQGERNLAFSSTVIWNFAFSLSSDLSFWRSQRG